LNWVKSASALCSRGAVVTSTDSPSYAAAAAAAAVSNAKVKLLAEVCFETGIVDRPVSASTVRRELRRLRVRWRQTKLWAPSPDPQYALKKARRDRLIEVAAKHPDWVLGFVDEVWWSRLQRPRMRAWADGPPLRMHVLVAEDSDPDPIAICCYGMLRNDTKRVMLRFAENRPLSDITAQFLEWVSQELREEGKKRLIVIWDDASWHASRLVLHWLAEHNNRVRREGGIEVVHFELPAKSPWLNDIEHYFRHAKKVIVEPGPGTNRGCRGARLPAPCRLTLTTQPALPGPSGTRLSGGGPGGPAARTYRPWRRTGKSQQLGPNGTGGPSRSASA
jgi:hypothetical protein